MAPRILRAAAIAQTVAARIVALALPPRCPGCGTVVDGDHRFCAGCWQSLEFLGASACAGCGARMSVDLGAQARCGACLAHPRALDRVRAAVAYGDVARRLAIRLKHGNRPGAARTIAAQMVRLVTAEGADTLIAPVPLHRWRIWSRGYNQSALIARALARRSGHPLAVDLVRRTRHTPLLRGLGRRARARAVDGAFAVRSAEAVRGRRIILIDDVYTTGATADACARVLKRAGARAVTLVCWARVMREDEGAEPRAPR